MTIFGIFLDDERFPEEVTWMKYPEKVDWYVVRNMRDFVFFIMAMDNFDEVIFSFDHDIADTNGEGVEVTGYDCLKYLIGYCIDHNIKIPMCVFHTMNPVGKNNMSQYYNNALENFM